MGYRPSLPVGSTVLQIKHLDRLRKSFLTQMILALFGLSLVSLIIGIRLSTGVLFRELDELETKYNRIAVERIQRDINEWIDGFNNLFLSIYLEDFPGITIESLVAREENDINQERRNQLINGKLRLTSLMYPHISELVVLDYARQTNYSYSRLSGRDIRLDYDFFANPTIAELSRQGTRRLILAPSEPDYIYARSVETSYPVLTIGMTIFDNRYFDQDEPIGAIFFNIASRHFQDLIDSVDPGFSGRITISHEDGFLVYDSAEFTDIELTEVEPEVFNLHWEELVLTYQRDDTIRRSLVRKNQLLATTILIVVGTLLIIAVYVLSHRIRRRLEPLEESMVRVQNGDFKSTIPITHTDEFSRIEESYNTMCSALEEYIHKAFVADLQVQKAQLKLLRQQFNPHFMYNTLQSIQMKAILNEDPETAEMVQALGELFRWALKDEAEVSLREEMLFLKKYFVLQNHRFENQLVLDDHLTPDLLSCRVLKMMLQPLMENAISHGLKAGSGSMTIEGLHEDASLLIIFSDDGEGMSRERRHSVLDAMALDESPGDKHIGLWNLNRRISRYYGSNDFGIQGIDSSASGTSVRIRIPWKGQG